jgi:hypothetical protein
VGGVLGPLGESLRSLIGFNRCSVRELLGIGVALPDAQGRALESLCNTAGTQVTHMDDYSRNPVASRCD